MGKVKLKTVAGSVAATIARMAGKNYQGIAVVSSLICGQGDVDTIVRSVSIHDSNSPR
jgi:hypothetical protein